MNGNNLFDTVVIMSCKGFACLATFVLLVCTAIALYGFFETLISLATN